MKHIKTYELYTKGIDKGTGQIIDYGVGDTVVCINDFAKPKPLKKGNSYKVLKIYDLLEDKFLNNKWLRVDVEDVKTGEITKGWESTRFKAEIENVADIYNL